MATQEPPASGLLALPIEIRNRIWGLVLPPGRRVVLRQDRLREPGLLAVCQQIRAEAAHHFWRMCSRLAGDCD